MGGLVAARPDAMRQYVLGVRGRREDAEEVRAALVRAHEQLVGALPAGFAAPGLPDIAGPLTRCRDVDGYVATVADRFADAGSVGPDGVHRMDGDLLADIPYTSRYGEAHRRRLREQAEEELARLREHLSSGSADETTVGEMVATLGWMRFEVDRAPTPEARQRVAADLIDTMGAGDVQGMLDLLEGELDQDGADVDAVRSTLEDLAVVTSLGLEAQPGRAQRWAGQLAGDHDWYHDGPPEMLVALGALVAPGTATLGLAVWRQVWSHTYMPSDQGTLPVHQHRADDGGPLDRLLGSPNAIEVLADSAADRPELANAIVMGTITQGPEGFEHLLAQGGTQNPSLGGDGTYDALGRMLTASVDIRLPLEDRLLAASQTMTMYDHVLHDGPDYFYAAPVLEGLGTMTQPLLANLHPSEVPGESRIQLPGLPVNDAANPFADHLENVIRDLAQSEGGTAGLARAVEGATTELIHRSAGQAVDAGSVNPLHEPTLVRTGEMMDWVVGAVTSERVDALVSAIEGGGWDAGLQAAVLEGLGATRLEPVSVVAESVLAAAGQDVVPGGSVLGDDPETRITYHLVLANLAARPEIASPQLLQALQDAANPAQAGAPRGAEGIALFLADDTISEPAYPGLAELRASIHHQEQLIGHDAAALLAEVFGVG